MTRRLAAACGVVTMASSLLLAATAGTATADPVDIRASSDLVQQLTVGVSDTLLPLKVDGLAPGSVVTRRFEVHRASSLSEGRFAVDVVDVQDFEDGCGHSEAADGDTTCGSTAGQGELSGQLLVKQQWSPFRGDCKVAPAPTAGVTIAAAASSITEAATDTNAADVACLVLVFELPFAANNLVQSDSAVFDLRIGLLDAAHDGDLIGGSGNLAVGRLGDGSLLPFTGLALGPRLSAALLLLLAGAASLRAGRVHRA